MQKEFWGRVSNFADPPANRKSFSAWTNDNPKSIENLQGPSLLMVLPARLMLELP